jgi:ABC-type phosphate/phosphonate transport system substrate-binding protein
MSHSRSRQPLPEAKVTPPLASAESFPMDLERGMGMQVLGSRLPGYSATIAALREGCVDAASLGDLASHQEQAAGDIERLLKTMVAGISRQRTGAR